MKERNDDYNSRGKHLEKMTDLELKKYFYELADKIIDPLIELGKENTSKSIERSVLLRMGFNSLQCKEIVDQLHEADLLKKGAGHCIYRLSKDKEISLEEAGEKVIKGEEIKYLQEVLN